MESVGIIVACVQIQQGAAPVAVIIFNTVCCIPHIGRDRVDCDAPYSRQDNGGNYYSKWFHFDRSRKWLDKTETRFSQFACV